MFRKKPLIFKFFIFLIIGISLLSCSKKEIVKPEIRAVNKWNSLIANDWKKAYSFQSPSYRKNFSLTDYQNSFGQSLKWLEIQHKSTKLVTPNIADVTLILVVKYASGSINMNIPSEINERWQLIGDTWWQVKSNSSN